MSNGNLEGIPVREEEVLAAGIEAEPERVVPAKWPLRIVSGLAENTNSIICDGSSSLRQQMDVRSCRDAGTTSREALMRSEGS
jgi:hypothetical protein